MKIKSKSSKEKISNEDSENLKLKLISTKVFSCCHESLQSSERLYKYKILNPYDVSILSCFALHNGICVLKFSNNCAANSPLNPEHMDTFEYKIDYETNKIKGKRKKEAYKVQVGEVVATVTVTSRNAESEVITKNLSLHSPISGQLLEINDKIVLNPSILLGEYSLHNFVAILFPSIRLPDFETINDSSTEILHAMFNFPRAQLSEQVCSKKSRICFDWVRSGVCTRGDNCRFHHDPRKGEDLVDTDVSKID